MELGGTRYLTRYLDCPPCGKCLFIYIFIFYAQWYALVCGDFILPPYLSDNVNLLFIDHLFIPILNIIVLVCSSFV